MKNLILISLLFLLFNCKNNSPNKETKATLNLDSTALSAQEPEWFSIDVDKALENETKERIPFSTFVKNIEYMPLETTSKSLIGGGRHGIQIHQVTKKIIVADLKMFNRKDGSYIGNILSRGQGPGEYLYPSFLAADDEREEIYVYDPAQGKILIAGYDGRYKGEFACGGDSDMLIGIFTLGNGNLLIKRGKTMRYSYDDFYVINVDTKEVLYKKRSSALADLENLDDCKHLNKTKYGQYWTTQNNIFWRYKKDIRYYDYLTDSIYTIGKDLKIKPIGSVDIKGLKQKKMNGETWLIHNILETMNEILISIRSSGPSGSTYYVLSYSKTNKETHSSFGYLNDIDNGDSYGPCYNARNYRFVSPETIKELIVEQGASAYTTEKEKAFKAMADKVHYDDNEFIMLFHFK